MQHQGAEGNRIVRKAYHGGTMVKTLISWGPALLWMGLLFFLSSLSHVPGESLFPLSDKVAHFGMFGVLGAALAWARGRAGAWTENGDPPGHQGSRREPKPARARLPGSPWSLGPILVGVLFAASDEWHQSFVPGRDPSFGDLAADLTGLTLGFLIGAVLIRRRAAGRSMAA